MVATWSVDDSEEDEIENQVMGLTVKCTSDNEYSVEEISDEELVETFKLMYKKWQETCKYGEKLEKTVNNLVIEKKRLQVTNNNLQEEVTLLKSRLEGMTKSVCMLNNNTCISYSLTHFLPLLIFFYVHSFFVLATTNATQCKDQNVNLKGLDSCF